MYAMIKQKNTLSALPPFLQSIYTTTESLSLSPCLPPFLLASRAALFVHIQGRVVGYYMGGRCGWIHKTQDHAVQAPGALVDSHHLHPWGVD